MEFKSETTQTTTDDIDELFSWSQGWDFEYTQLTAGRLGFRERVLQLPGVAIKWHTATQALLVRETFLSGLGFGFVRHSVGPTRWRGREIDVHDGLLYQRGCEQHYALGRSTSSMSIELDDRLVHALGWNLDCVAPLQRFDPVAIKDLELICAEVKWMTEQDSIVPSCTQLARPGSLDLLSRRDAVLRRLRKVLQPWFACPGQVNASVERATPGFLLVSQAVAYALRRDDSSIPSNAELASQLHVSERTLFRAFQGWVGMSPQAFFELRRLHLFRRFLFAAPRLKGAITKAAMQSGITHMGRLSERYRKQFGESPSEALKRRLKT